LEGIFGGQGNHDATLQGGRLFECAGGWTAGPINSSITVFDIHGSRPFREIAHFAAPGVGTCCPLPDGRSIVGGVGKLWLLGPPPGVEEAP
jgi:hypothetical protein